MSKDVITIEGEDVVVREDAAKSYHGVMWVFITGAMCLAMMAGLFVGLFWIGM
jgi:hypothetical protein